MVGGLLGRGLGFVLGDDFLVLLSGVGGGVFGFGFGGFFGAVEVGAGFFFDGADLWGREKELGGVLWWRKGGIWGEIWGEVDVRVPHYPQHRRRFSARSLRSRMLSPGIPSLLPGRLFSALQSCCRRLRRRCPRPERSW